MIEKEEKPNCYKCKYRRQAPGSAHSVCKHPCYGKANDDPLMGLLSIFASVGRVGPIQAQAEGIKVVGNEYGIRSGWFNHPFNFDPTWLVSCTGFEEKEEDE